MVLHRCDNRPCINVEHLYLGTHRDNMNDMRDRKRAHRPMSLSFEDARQVRCLLALDIRQYWIASAFGVSQATVSRIYNRLFYKDNL